MDREKVKKLLELVAENPDLDIDTLLDVAMPEPAALPEPAPMFHVEQSAPAPTPGHARQLTIPEWADGKKKQTRKRWTMDEDRKMLSAVKEGFTPEEIAPLLPGRTKEAIKSRLSDLRGKKAIAYDYTARRYTPDEIDQLWDALTLYGKPHNVPADVRASLAKEQNRTDSAIITKLNELHHEQQEAEWQQKGAKSDETR